MASPYNNQFSFNQPNGQAGFSNNAGASQNGGGFGNNQNNGGYGNSQPNGAGFGNSQNNGGGNFGSNPNNGGGNGGAGFGNNSVNPGFNSPRYRPGNSNSGKNGSGGNDLDQLSVNFKNALEEWEEQFKFLQKRPVSFMEKVQRYRRTIFWMVIFHIGLIWASVYYYIITRARLRSVLGEGLTIARLAAAMHRWCFAIILFCVAHRTTRFFRRLLNNKFIPWSEWKLFHSVMGIWIMIASLLHIGAHFYNMNLIAQVPAVVLNCALERPIPNGAENDGNIYHADCCAFFPTQVDCCPQTCPDPANPGMFLCAVGSPSPETCNNGNIDQFLPSPVNTTEFGFGEPVIHYVAVRQYSELFLHLGGTWGWSGWLLALFLFSLWAFTNPTLKRKYFEAFWLTHLSYPLIYILQYIHGAENLLQDPEFWFWTLPVVFIYTFEKAYAIYARRVSYPVKEAELYPSKFGEAIRVTISKPYGFSYACGEWVWVLVPEISKFEWHPVAICTANEDEDNVQVLFQRLGDWSDELYNLFRRHALKQDGRQVKLGVQGLVNDTVRGAHVAAPTVKGKGPAALTPTNMTLHRMNPARTGAAGTSDDEVKSFESLLEKAQIRGGYELARVFVANGIDYQKIHSYTEADFGFLQTGDRRQLLEFLMNDKETRTGKVKVDQVICHIRMDGPYGSYGEDAYNFESIMLFGGGVGVTPMISVLQSIRRHHMAKRPMKIRKIRFYWTFRDRSMISWVREDIIECRRDLKDLLEVRLYETRNSDLVEIRLDNELNIFSGRLPLDTIYQDTIAGERDYAQETGKTGQRVRVGVFGTGPPTITTALEIAAVQHRTPECDFVFRLVE